MKILMANCPNLSADKNQIAVWYELLKDLTNEQILGSISIFCASHREVYPGTNIVAYIREYAFYDPQELTPEEAYEVARKSWRRWSRYDARKPFDDLLLEKTIQTIGVAEILDNENVEALRAHFLKIYASHQKRSKMLKMMGFGSGAVDGLKKIKN